MNNESTQHIAPGLDLAQFEKAIRFLATDKTATPLLDRSLAICDAAYAELQQLRAQRDRLAGAMIRMMVGVTRESLPTCDYYEGIEHDACDEARAALASLEGGKEA